MSSEKLFTIFLIFSDHAVGIAQYKVETPEDAAKQFIRASESLEEYDRSLLLRSLMPLTQLANEKGVWLFHFDPDLMEIEWPGENAALGGYIVQTDDNAPSRSK